MKAKNVIEAKELIEKNLKNKNFEIIDVRTFAEYNEGHLKGARLLILDEIYVWAETLDKNKEYLIYCRSGGRSAMATSFLNKKGINATNMLGGIIDWNEEKFEIEK